MLMPKWIGGGGGGGDGVGAMSDSGGGRRGSGSRAGMYTWLAGTQRVGARSCGRRTSMLRGLLRGLGAGLCGVGSGVEVAAARECCSCRRVLQGARVSGARVGSRCVLWFCGGRVRFWSAQIRQMRRGRGLVGCCSAGGGWASWAREVFLAMCRMCWRTRSESGP